MVSWLETETLSAKHSESAACLCTALSAAQRYQNIIHANESFVVREHCALTGLRYAEAESDGSGVEEARNAAEAINL